jgi:Mn-dependent DtxR family transcriptional regulator
VIFLTPIGFQLAAAIVRNHRLWELYLTNQAHIAVDHVHEDAEKIEHVLGEEVVRELERKLGYATIDPHGRAIPNLDEIRRAAASAPRDTLVGYGNKP